MFNIFESPGIHSKEFKSSISNNVRIKRDGEGTLKKTKILFFLDYIVKITICDVDKIRWSYFPSSLLHFFGLFVPSTSNLFTLACWLSFPLMHTMQHSFLYILSFTLSHSLTFTYIGSYFNP